MHAKMFTLTVLSIFALSACSVQVPEELKIRPQVAVVKTDHLTWASDLLTRITSANTDYVHGTPNVTWYDANVAGSVTQSYTDCSGLFGELLKKAYNADLKTWFGKSRPTAADVFNTIDAQTHFLKVGKATDLQAGDVIAMKYLDPDATATGHVMVVAAAPTLFQNADQTNPLPNPSELSNYEEYLVKVIDSSSAYHGTQDTRYNSTSKTAYPGAGSGYFRLYASKTDKSILGYTWSNSKNSDFYGPSVRPLLVGRVML
ncbi:hypothetical protein [Deinococcus roseus]|uniref:Amidase domain-containing protein n=1 Tax=Deinococcus roseus TaxID=392414 RepID=A0ABQ2D2W7_9DEIO|nr:hypothetical protein [Deinococcus roseus]GGJ39535.1 hypothetical protein GCM10008938_27010 [Deinococcus roseus]